MNRLPAFFLVLVAIVPGLLTGSSVYHCRVTGWHGLTCGCESAVEAGGCCQSSLPEDPQAPGCHSQPSSDCCDVTIFRVSWTPGSTLPEVTPPVETGELVFPDHGSLTPLSQCLARADSSIGAVREGSPLYIEYSVYRC